MSDHVQLTRDQYDALVRDIDANAEHLAHWSRRAARLNAELIKTTAEVYRLNAENSRLRRESLLHTALAAGVEDTP